MARKEDDAPTVYSADVIDERIITAPTKKAAKRGLELRHPGKKIKNVKRVKRIGARNQRFFDRGF